MSTQSEEGRARFEAWVASYSGMPAPTHHYSHGYIGAVHNRYRDCSYADIDLLWQAWQAALSATPAVGDGYVVVQRELCEKLEDQLIDLSNEKSERGQLYAERERIHDADILQQLRIVLAAAPEASQRVEDKGEAVFLPVGSNEMLGGGPTEGDRE